MRRLFATALAGALLAAVPRAAIAQPTVAPTIYCVPGAAHACFAAAFVSDGTSATFWIQNLQGTYSADPTPFNIGAILVERISETEQFTWAPGGEGAGDQFVFAEGAVRTGPPGWSLVEEDSDAGVDAHQQRRYSAGIGQVGLAGCTSPSAFPEEPFLGWSTCVRDGETGWMRIDFRAFMSEGFGETKSPDFLREVELTDIDLWIGSANLEVGCAIRGANSGAPLAQLPECIATPYDLTTVPEPATLALLGGGLLLVGGVGAMRRRPGA